MKKFVLIFLTVICLLFTQVAYAAVDSIESPYLPPVIEEIIEEVQPIYTITVTTIDIFGNVIEAPISTPVEVGRLIETNPGVFQTMPSRNVEIAQIYIPDELLNNPNFYLLTIDDYDTPLGLGAMQMNIGHCVE